MGIVPPNRDEHKKYLKPPPSNLYYLHAYDNWDSSPHSEGEHKLQFPSGSEAAQGT